MVLVSTLFVLMLKKYRIDHYIYISQISLIGKGIAQLGIDLFRWIIGLFGVTCVLTMNLFISIGIENLKVVQ